MSVSLFRHNQEAYFAAVDMLAAEGKAAVVHPTGTGKSFIGFKLCEDNPGKTVCWLSPSEYIFKTQIENLKRVSDGFVPGNIKFFTYAKLVTITDKELRDIKADFIVIDEFHRCGAEMWGQGVQKVLKMYPNAPILGLSATAIRYLDNQRNMADELFDGNIASEMTLGEAIVRGILDPPTYVLSVFAYQQDYDKIKARVRRTKSKVVRDSAERYLEGLRRALEMADGLDVIFDKYMTDRMGKYIVFCSSLEHIREMRKNVPDWFAKLDTNPHIYTVYSNDSAADKTFADFRNDNSNHLKLLFCIDMLNEGVHVDGISGVILFRPTVSPIIYKQQIGRALSVSDSKEKIIFDIVNNIENLYSISAVQQEMQIAINNYRFLGEDGYVVNERFKVIDELRNARELFEHLNETLTASWDMMYSYAKQYYAQYGNLLIPRRYKTADGYGLGSWIFTQRKIYNGEQYGSLGEDRINKLEAIGMVWDSVRELSWKRYYAAAKQYYETNGDLKVSALFVTDKGINLGTWIANMRAKRSSLTKEQIMALEAIGMIWEAWDFQWEKNYLACKEYFVRNGNLNIPADFATADGLRIGTWLRRQRQIRNGTITDSTLNEEQIERLNAIGMEWRSYAEVRFEAGMSSAVKYYTENGDLNAPTTYIDENGYALGKWLNRQREKYSGGSLTTEQINRLSSLGMVWAKEDPWETKFMLAEAYYKEHGNLNVPSDYVADGVWLNKWLNEQKQAYNGKRKNSPLTAERIKRLENIGMTFNGTVSAAWEENFKEAQQYYIIHGDLKVPVDYIGSNGNKLSVWLLRQRKAYRDANLNKNQIERLCSIGMVWQHDDPWEVGFSHAKDYFSKNGNLNVPKSYRCDDGFSLGCWLKNQRANLKSSDKYRKVTSEQRKRLDEIGMSWSPAEDKWNAGSEHAKEYLEALQGRKASYSYISPDGYKTGEWLRSQIKYQKARGLSIKKKQRLESIGIEFYDSRRKTPQIQGEEAAQIN